MSEPKHPNEEKIVLVIDDMADVGQTISRICHSLGVRSETILNGDNLPGILAYTKADAIMADIMMPDQDGYNIMRTVSEYNKNIPVLMMTGGDSYLLEAAVAIAEIHQLTRVSMHQKPIKKAVVRDFLFAAGILPSGSR